MREGDGPSDKVNSAILRRDILGVSVQVLRNYKSLRKSQDRTGEVQHLQRRRRGFADVKMINELEELLWANTVARQLRGPGTAEGFSKPWLVLWHQDWELVQMSEATRTTIWQTKRFEQRSVQ